VSGHWLIYVRRSYKKLGSELVAASADTSDETQLERCLALLPAGATYEVITDSGGHQSGRSDKRVGWQEVIGRVAGGGVAGVVAYDLSRLARNARLVLNLHHSLTETDADLRVAQMPNTDFTSAQGKLVLGMMAITAQFQADYDSQRMQDMMRRTFEAGGHRGNDPFGYATARNEKGEVVHPRALVIDESEAAIVRRAFALLVREPFSSVAAILNREGAQHRGDGPWTSSRVKDLCRRRQVYLGNVQRGRDGGAEVRPGNHDAILTEEEFSAAVVGVESRKRHTGKRPATSKEVYVLRGLVYCSCGTRMQGDARRSRGQMWRYYLCPLSERKRAVRNEDGSLRVCAERRVPAEEAERVVIAKLREHQFTDEEVMIGRARLAELVAADTPGTADKERERLERALKRLGDRYTWGDLEEADYRRQVGEIRNQLAALPAPDRKMADYDKRLAEFRAFSEIVPTASRDELQELVPQVVARVETASRAVVRVIPKESQLAFFEAEMAAEGCAGMAPPDGLEPPTRTLGRCRSIH
jgi:DNA invertase Pin-like site-specific DNA recombinase